MTRALRAVLLLALIIAAAESAVAGQTQGSTQLTVTVTDTSGARVPDAAVILMRPTDERTIVTDRDGTATVRGLAAGAWTVEVAKQGFVTRQRRIVVQSTPTAVAVTLEIGALEERVLVEAAAPVEDALLLDAAATGGTRTQYSSARAAGNPDDHHAGVDPGARGRQRDRGDRAGAGPDDLRRQRLDSRHQRARLRQLERRRVDHAGRNPSEHRAAGRAAARYVRARARRGAEGAGVANGGRRRHWRGDQLRDQGAAARPRGRHAALLRVL